MKQFFVFFAFTLVALISVTGVSLAQVTGKSVIMQDDALPTPNRITLQPPSLGLSTYALTLPSNLPVGDDYIFLGDRAGLLSWQSPATVVGNVAWLLEGNNGLTDGTDNFLGTLDATPIRFITNGTANERMQISGTTGNIGIATTPHATDRLSVSGNINSSTQYNIANARVLAVPGSSNTVVGRSTGTALTSGVDNTFVGQESGTAITTGIRNTFLGSTTGIIATDIENNTYLGYAAGARTLSGNHNVAIGVLAGDQVGSSNNVFIGSNAGQSDGGGGNVAIGYLSGSANTSGSGNAFLGAQAGENTDAGNNTFIGALTGSDNTSGAGNTFIGKSSGTVNATGSNNTALGNAANVGSTALTNATAIGAQALVSASNSLVLGAINGTNGATANTNIGIGLTSPVHRLDFDDALISNANTSDIAIRANTTFAPTVAYSAEANLVDMVLNVNNSAAITGTSTRVLDVGSSFAATASAAVDQITGIRGYSGSLNTNASSFLTRAVGVQGHIDLGATSARIVSGVSLQATASMSTSSLLQNYTGLEISEPNPAATGTVQNITGISIAQLSRGTISNRAFLYSEPTNPVAIMGNGDVGIGTSAPGFGLHVTRTPTLTGSTGSIASVISNSIVASAGWTGGSQGQQVGVSINNGANVITTSSVVRGSDIRADRSSSSTANVNATLAGARLFVVNGSASGTLSQAVGTQIFIDANANSTTDSALSVSTFMNVATGATVNSYSGLRIGTANISGTGVVNHLTGIYLRQQVLGTLSNTAFNYDNPSSPFIIEGDGDVGIGTSTPTSKLQVSGSFSNPATTGTLAGSDVVFNPTVAATSAPRSFSATLSLQGSSTVSIGTGGASSIHGFTSFSNSSGGNLTGPVYGVQGTFSNNKNSAGVSVDRGFGVFGASVGGSASPSTTLAGVAGYITNTGTGTVTNARILSVVPPGVESTGPITNLTGLYIDPVAYAGATNRAIYYNNASRPFVVDGDGEVGLGTTSTSHVLTVLNNSTTDEYAGVYGHSDQASNRQTIGVWGDASGTSFTNTGTIGMLATGSGNTSAGLTNTALQVNDGHFRMGRTAELSTGATIVEPATAGNTYTADGPSGVIEIEGGAADASISSAGNYIASVYKWANRITITNRYTTTSSIILLQVLDVSDGTTNQAATAIASQPLTFSTSVDDRALGSFVITVDMHNTTGVNPLTVDGGAVSADRDKIRIGYVIINAGM